MYVVDFKHKTDNDSPPEYKGAEKAIQIGEECGLDDPRLYYLVLNSPYRGFSPRYHLTHCLTRLVGCKRDAQHFLDLADTKAWLAARDDFAVPKSSRAPQPKKTKNDKILWYLDLFEETVSNVRYPIPENRLDLFKTYYALLRNSFNHIDEGIFLDASSPDPEWFKVDLDILGRRLRLLTAEVCAPPRNG